MRLKLETESPLQMWAVPSLNPNSEPHSWTVKEEKMVEDGRPIVQRDKRGGWKCFGPSLAGCLRLL